MSFINPHDYVLWYHDKFQQGQDYPHIIQDHEVLILLIKKYEIRSVFEIGTWLGDSALLMYLYPAINKLKTINIYTDMRIDYKHHLHSRTEPKDYGAKIKHTNAQFEFADSKVYQPEVGEWYDMVFIDGDHRYDMVRSDTELALKMHPKLIAWHDYGGGNDEVIRYIDEMIVNGSDIKLGKSLGFSFSVIAYMENKNRGLF